MFRELTGRVSITRLIVFQQIDPFLTNRECSAVDLPLVCFLDKSGGCLETGEIRAVPELSLGVAPNDLISLGQWNPEVNLLFSSLRIDNLDKGSIVQQDLQ